LSVVGDGHHRNDQPAGSETRARGRDLLRDDRARHRLRLLAPGARFGDRRHDRPESGGERQDGAAGHRRRRVAAAASANVRVRTRTAARDYHAPGVRAGAGETAPGADYWQVHFLEAHVSIVVTGSIAFDYLMSFPGKFTEHFLPEHMQRVSLSFLVDSMDKR